MMTAPSLAWLSDADTQTPGKYWRAASYLAVRQIFRPARTVPTPSAGQTFVPTRPG